MVPVTSWISEAMAATRELPFEAEPDIDQDADHGDDHGDRAAGDQLAGNGRADHLDAAIFDRIAERLLHLGDRFLLLLLRRLGGDADEHGIGCAEFLDLNLAETEPVHLAANVGEIGRALLGLDLDRASRPGNRCPYSSRRFATRMQRNNGQQGRHDPGDRPQPDEVDLGVRGDEMDACGTCRLFPKSV